MDSKDVAGEICGEGALYRNELCFLGYLLWKNFISVLALLGPWPEISLAGEALKDLGLPYVLRVVRKDDGKRTIYHLSALERSLAPWEGGTALGMVTLQAWLFWLLLRGAIPLLVTNVQGFLYGVLGVVPSHSIGVICDPITAISCISKRTCRYPEDKRCLLQRKVLGFLGDVMWFLILPYWLSSDFWGLKGKPHPFMAEEAAFALHTEPGTLENCFLARLPADPAAGRLPFILPTRIRLVWGELCEASLRFAAGNTRQVSIPR